MNKLEVLKVMAKPGNFMRPDEIRRQIFLPPERRSFYSYLIRLASQGLLERGPGPRRRGKLIYRITDRGLAVFSISVLIRADISAETPSTGLLTATAALL